jgi:hypothetical protein
VTPLLIPSLRFRAVLKNAGEDRFAVVDYATEAELADVGD